MSFSNTVTLESNVPLTDIHPTIEPTSDFNESEYHVASSQDSDGDEVMKETTDLSVPHVPGVNLATGEMPSMEEFPGVYGFSLMMGSGGTEQKSSKKSWEYSLQMNKLYVKVGCMVPVSFKINSKRDWTGLQVRGLVVYDNPDESRKPVERCHTHKDPHHKSNLNNDRNSVSHVLCCQHSGAVYETDRLSGRHSVTTAVGEPQAGATFITILYALMCKSSCEGGIGRRGTSVIFTLEKENKVVGRHVVRVRICSCPKRDMTQEFEQQHNHSATARVKKRKMPTEGPIRIKTEAFAPFAPPAPEFGASGVGFPPLPRYEQISYMEVRSPTHYKILLNKAYELFKNRVTHQAAIYENLIKQV